MLSWFSKNVNLICIMLNSATCQCRNLYSVLKLHFTETFEMQFYKVFKIVLYTNCTNCTCMNVCSDLKSQSQHSYEIDVW